MTILVSGAGIAGLTMALTCHEIGIDVKVYEAAEKILPLGVGINLQPNAVRELIQLGLEAELRKIGIEAEEWALFFYGAHPIWTESRGTLAGYNWPQFSVHRGQFQMTLLQTVQDRLGKDSVVTDARLTGFDNKTDCVTAHFERSNGELLSVDADALIGADGINSNVRQQMYPDQPELNWNGAVMWRGVSRAAPPRTKNSFVMVGGIEQRFICYPVEPLDDNGETLLNWIAELRYDAASVDKSDWNKKAHTDAFLGEFLDWKFDWLSVPEIVSRSTDVWEYPMVDRDPIEQWVDGRVALIGDAAHAMFPHGSGGASQAIVDTRVMGSCLRQHSIIEDAFKDYEGRLLEPVNELVMRNRGEGPIGVLIDIEKRLADGMKIDEAIDKKVVADFMQAYKEAAGTSRDKLNASAPII